MEYSHYLARDLVIAVEAGTDDNPLGAETHRHAHGHGRVDPVLAGFVGGRSHHTSDFGAASYQHWLTLQLRVVQLLHCGVEGVQVGVENVTHRGYPLLELHVPLYFTPGLSTQHRQAVTGRLAPVSVD